MLNNRGAAVEAGQRAASEDEGLCGPAPRVSIGVPVYNGAATLARALDSLVVQTLRDIEIIISDNGSTDRTGEICREYVERDRRIRYFRQRQTVSATDNFKFVLAAARADYFMWAAHDDVRDADYVEKLLAGLEHNSRAILAFGDVVEIKRDGAAPLPLDFANAALKPVQRLRREAMYQLHHLYGLWRIEKLRRIRWRHVDWWHDTPLMMAATLIGEYVYVPGVEFRYQANRHPFFNWRRDAGLSGHLRNLAGRVYDAGRLVWLCGATVGRVAGMRLGLVAAWFAFIKLLAQVKGFVAHRI